ncbi:hypothetical protein DFH27DRAFT_561522 [Peziza echinospora]|nr:hypothetical protein DFH27DRAFT_561522 [Peziza echinospora]
MTPAGHDDGDSPPENMDEPSPVPAFLRKSSLSFASLPPREPLGGGRASTASATTETVRLNGVGRSSWLAGRRTLGRSLGGRLTMGDAVIGEDGEETPPKQPSVPAPAERKRSRGADEMSVDPQQPRQPQPEEPAPEAQAKPAHRKKSRSASYRSGDEEASLPSPKETAVESPRGAAAAEESDSSTRLVAKHNKMASQRLQEKILMLGKLSAPAAREGGSSHSTPVEAQDSTAPVYPDLTAYTGQTSAQQSSPAPPPPAVQQQPELTLTRGSRDNSPSDDEWIPPVRPASTKPLANKQFQKSRVAPGLSRSQTVPAHASPRNPAKDYLPRKGADDEMDIDEDENTGISRPKTARGDDAEAPKAISYPKSLGFHAINSPLGAHSARASGSPDRSSPITKTKSFSSLKKSNSTTDSPTGRQPRAVVSSESFKTQTMSAFNRAKAMFTQANNNSETTPVKASEKGSPAPEEGDTPVRTPQGSLRHRKEGLYPNLGPGSSGAKPRRNPRGSKGKEVSQRQQEEAEAEARRAEAQRLQEEEEEKQRLAEQQRLEEQRRLEEEEARIEKERRAEEERNARRVEEQRRQAEVRRREKEQQRKLQEEEAARQREKEEARKKEEEEYLRKQRELLQRKEDELRKIQEEQRAIVRRKEEERLRQQKEEELRNWQEAEERARIEDEERIRKEEEEEERRQAEEARLDELRRRQEEDIRRQQEADKRRAREITPVAAEDSENDETSKPARPKSAMGRPPSRIQPPSGGKRPLRPAAQKVERSKPQPVSIQIGTASQRAALDRHKTGPTPSSTLLSAMEKSFSQSGRPPSAEPSLHSSASAPQLKKSNSSTSVSSQARVKSLENAAQTVKKADMDRKREEHKKAIEARREEIRRKEALLEEEKRKAAAAAQGRRPIDKDPEPKKTLSKATGMKGPTSANKMMNRIAPLHVAENEYSGQQYKVTPDAEINTTKVPKRAYQAEEEAAAAMPPPAANPATASTYGNRLAPPKQPDSKKRKTEEWDQSIAQFEQALASSSSSHTTTTKAPVRPSAVKRDWPAKITYAQGYNTVPSATQSGMGRPNAPVDPTVKMATANHAAAKTASGGALHVDGVIKYSNEKIRFANEAIAASSSNTSTFTTTTTTTTMVPTNSNPSTSLTSNTSNTTSTTPAGVKKKSALKTPNNNPKEKKRVYTPMLGDGIELPDIPTDSGETDSESSDPDSSNEGGKDGKFSVPHWAESPELRQALYAQQTMDPEHVFGPMAPLHMDEIFRSRSGRFRARSSSANWSGADRLTTAEIEADAEARRRMIENGGWIYGNMNGL